MNASRRLLVPVFAVALSLGCGDATSPPDWSAFGSRASVWLPDPSAVIVHEYYSGFVDSADTSSFRIHRPGRPCGRGSMPVANHNHRSPRSIFLQSE